MNTTDVHAKVQAAQSLLLEPTTSREKLTAIRLLIQGINPKLDSVLSECDEHISYIEKAFQGQVIDLSVEYLPENTEEEKRRKKALLLLLNSWNKLKGEVARVKAEMDAANNASDVATKSSRWGRIFGGAKGPLGIITGLAVVIVVVMQQTAVTMTIQNQGCGAFKASGSMPIRLPGLKLPNGTIENGQSAEAVIPPLTFTIDGTQPGLLTLKALTFTVSLQLPASVGSVILDGTSLLNTKQDIQLSKSKNHTLVLQCA